MSMKLSLAGAVSALLVLSVSGSPFSEAQAKIKEKYPEEYEKRERIGMLESVADDFIDSERR